MEEIAQVYARSLFDVAREQDKLDDIRDQLSQFASALEEDRQLQVFFFSPYFSTPEKKHGLDRAVTGADETLVNFLKLLIENHRMPVVFRVSRAYEALWETENRLLPVSVTSAVELGPRDRRQDRRADQPQGRPQRAGRSGHPRRHRRARRQLGARRLRSQPT